MEKQEEAVWRRVQQASREGGGQGPSPEFPGRELSMLSGQAEALGNICLRLLPGASGQGRQALRGAANTFRQQAATLEALLRFRKGPPREPAENPMPPRQQRQDLIRRLLLETETYAGRLEALGLRTGGQAGALLTELSEEAGRIFRRLLAALL